MTIKWFKFRKYASSAPKSPHKVKTLLVNDQYQRLLINNRKAEPVAEELRRIGGGRRSYGRGSSGGKTEGQTVSYLQGYITLVILPWFVLR